MGDIVGVDKILADQLEAKGFGPHVVPRHFEPPPPTCQECGEDLDGDEAEYPFMCDACRAEFADD